MAKEELERGVGVGEKEKLKNASVRLNGICLC